MKELAVKELSNKRLFVVDAFCGANHDTRMAVRFIVEVAWQAHFIKNMFIQPTAEELENFEPNFIVYNASKAKVENYKELGLNSETAVMFNITSREQVIPPKNVRHRRFISVYTIATATPIHRPAESGTPNVVSGFTSKVGI